MRRFAVAWLTLSGLRTAFTVLSHDCLRQTGLRLQSAAGSAMQSYRAQ